MYHDPVYTGAKLHPGNTPRPNDTSRAPTPPFILADPVTLGFPVFTKPITTHKMTLGPFPKVTQFFAPVNGGDLGSFPRKEKVRSWKQGQKSIVGIGGGVLRFSSFSRGELLLAPSSCRVGILI